MERLLNLIKRTFQNKVVIGIDIGSFNIKLAHVNIKKEGQDRTVLTLNNVYTFPTPQIALKNFEVVDPDMIAEEIKSKLKEFALKATHAVISVNGPDVIVRPIKMDRLSEKEMKTAIVYEAEKYLPYSVDEAQVSGFIIDDKLKDDKKMEVVLISALKKKIELFEDIIKKSGLEVSAVEVAPVAILRLMDITYGDFFKDKTVAYIDIGANFISITVFAKTKLRQSRIISGFSGNRMTNLISNKLGVAFDEAERIKIEKIGIIQYMQDVDNETKKLYMIVKPVIDDMITEIHRSFDYYKSRYGGDNIDVILLSGGSSNILGLPEYIASQLHVEVYRFNPLKNIKKGKIKTNIDNLDKQIGEISLVLGLACRD